MTTNRAKTKLKLERIKWKNKKMEIKQNVKKTLLFKQIEEMKIRLGRLVKKKN